MPDVVGAADPVARVLVQSDTARLTSDNREVVTHCSALVLEVVRSRETEQLTASPVITIAKRGGTIAVDGRSVSFTDTEFPPLELGSEYVLLLKRGADGTYSTVYGGQGAFRIESNRADQVSKHHAAWEMEQGGPFRWISC